MFLKSDAFLFIIPDVSEVVVDVKHMNVWMNYFQPAKASFGNMSA